MRIAVDRSAARRALADRTLSFRVTRCAVDSNRRYGGLSSMRPLSTAYSCARISVAPDASTTAARSPYKSLVIMWTHTLRVLEVQTLSTPSTLSTLSTLPERDPENDRHPLRAIDRCANTHIARLDEQAREAPSKA